MKQIFEVHEPINRVNCSSDLFGKINKFKMDYNQENFILFYLDTKNKLITAEILFKGGVNACLICQKTIFRNALKHNACKIIIAHNHPSNCLEPSQEDRNIFDSLKIGGEILGIDVIDNIIFNKTEFYSFTDGGE